jgi:hypothetical protein
MVEIEQMDTSFDVEVKALNTIDPTKISYMFSDSNEEKSIFLIDQFANFGNDSVKFVDENTFCLSLISEVPLRLVSGLFNGQGWLVFSTHNVRPLKRGVKCQQINNITVSLQNYLLELPEEYDYGFIQFYSVPEVLRCDGKIYKSHSLMTIAVHRKSKRFTPSVITTKSVESEENLYVSLIPGQILQILSPTGSIVDVSSNELTLVKTEERTLYPGPIISSTLIKCERLLQRGEIVTIKQGKKYNAIWVAGIFVSKDGTLYPYFGTPYRKTNLISHNMAGFHVVDDKKSTWFCNGLAEISHGNGSVVTFTKPQKSVSIEHDEGYWLIDNSQAHELDNML